MVGAAADGGARRRSMPRTDEQLLDERVLVEAAQRDPVAFAQLYERYVDRIYAYVYALTRDRNLAEDITATTFVRAIEDLPRFEWRGIPYSAWLYRVAFNLVVRHRSRAPHAELPETLVARGAGPEEVALTRASESEMAQHLEGLPETQRNALLLRFGSDLSTREVAAIMGRTEGAVKLLTFRGLSTLRRRFNVGHPHLVEDDDV